MMPSAFDEIRTAVAKVDALAHAVESMFDDTDWNGEVDRQHLERMAHFVGAVAEAAAAAVVVVDHLNADLLNPAITTDEKPGEW
jgi:hypothetical protein